MLILGFRVFYFVLLLGGILTSLVRLPRTIWTSPRSLALLVASVTFVFVTWQRIYSVCVVWRGGATTVTMCDRRLGR